ncbi:MAG TPA: transcription antitermination factor NusB, partial [Tepidisphaeraceae bacterium]|nr:transcription antitermination factor NusB [Tepidisphaeraceae bacterium]
MISARDYALAELDAKRLPQWRPGMLRARGTQPARQVPEDPRDRALAEQIIIGVTKNLLHLQWLITHYTRRPLKQIDPLAQKIVAIGLYQLRCLTRIPPSAAVDEAVKQAKRVGHTRAAGFVNAVLRTAARNPEVPLPDRIADPAAYAERVLSHPQELFDRLAKFLGEERALLLCEHDNLEP